MFYVGGVESTRLVVLPRLKLFKFRVSHDTTHVLLGLLCDPVVGLKHVPQQHSCTNGAVVPCGSSRPHLCPSHPWHGRLRHPKCPTSGPIA